jgi:hypothetical protein
MYTTANSEVIQGKSTPRLASNTFDVGTVSSLSRHLEIHLSPRQVESGAEAAIQVTGDSCQLSKTAYPQLSLGHLTPTASVCSRRRELANWHNYYYWCRQQVPSLHTHRPLSDNCRLINQLALTAQLHQQERDCRSRSRFHHRWSSTLDPPIDTSVHVLNPQDLLTALPQNSQSFLMEPSYRSGQFR